MGGVFLMSEVPLYVWSPLSTASLAGWLLALHLKASSKRKEESSSSSSSSSSSEVQACLAHKKLPPHEDHHRSLGIVLL